MRLSSPVLPRGRRLVNLVLVTACVLVILIECAVIVRAGRSDDGRDLPASADTVALVAPHELPARGALVLSEVRPDGTVGVSQWIRSPEGFSELSVAAPDLTGVDGLSVTDGRVVAADGTVLADDLPDSEGPSVVRFDRSTTMVRATYVLQGGTAGSPTVEGRVLAQAVSLDLSYPDQTGPTVVVVAAAGSGVVRNLACANARSTVALLRPCGEPDGLRWRVRLPSESRLDRVVAQVDMP